MNGLWMFCAKAVMLSYKDSRMPHGTNTAIIGSGERDVVITKLEVVIIEA